MPLQAVIASDVLILYWRNMIISTSTDGGRHMTGHARVVATHFKQAAFRGSYSIWCGFNQLKIKWQSFFAFLKHEEF